MAPPPIVQLSHENYDEFMETLKRHRDIDERILRSQNIDKEGNRFRELTRQFVERENLIRSCRKKIQDDIRALSEEIRKTDESNEGAMLWENELRKLELKKKQTFERLVNEELKREDFNKTRAMEMYLSSYADNELNSET